MYEQSVVCVCVLSNNNEKMIVSDILFIRLKRQNIASTTQPASHSARPDHSARVESREGKGTCRQSTIVITLTCPIHPFSPSLHLVVQTVVVRHQRLI